jgi:hypothetical protein
MGSTCKKGKSKVKGQKSKVKSASGGLFSMANGLRIVSELPWFFVGLDLGQSRDHSALAVVERAEIFLDLRADKIADKTPRPED